MNPTAKRRTSRLSTVLRFAAWRFGSRIRKKAYKRALELGAQPVEIATGPMELRQPAIKGIGGAPLYLFDRFGDGTSIYDIDFLFIEGVDRNPVGAGLKFIDHLTPPTVCISIRNSPR
ncbi:4-hydroxyphenylpyruvate dioxygenase [compost metagenome]